MNNDGINYLMDRHQEYWLKELEEFHQRHLIKYNKDEWNSILNVFIREEYLVYYGIYQLYYPYFVLSMKNNKEEISSDEYSEIYDFVNEHYELIVHPIKLKLLNETTESYIDMFLMKTMYYSIQ